MTRHWFLFLLGLSILVSACRKNKTTFNLIPSSHSGIDFINDITEYDSFNILNTEFIYNGAGVGVGDLNADGLEDLFFAGNQVGNACYLNEGNFKFKEITALAHLQKPDNGMWSSGVNIIDLDGDGKKDIYVTNTLIRNAAKRKNLFYHNKGNNANGIPLFEEIANQWGLDDTSYASHAQFFDYDRDGDLDLFIGTNYIDKPTPGQYYKNANGICDQNCDKLYRNEWDSLSHQPRFIDVSISAGLIFNGYSHSTLIHDFNEDDYPDIYVANDYQSDDLIYINNKNGTFTNQNAKIFKHQSSSAMGSDLGDINNDGKQEVMTVEMLPFTNLRKKTLIGPGNYASYIFIKEYGYQYQFTRNTLQLHQGMADGYPIYSDISFLSNVHETEWSWAPLFADFDLDMNQDLYITNGFPKDVTDHDFGQYRNETRNLIGDMELQNLIPVVKVSNFMFQNMQDLRFANKTKEWGLEVKSFSNGAAYGDLDNDGDLDLIVHNIDDAPFIFNNNTIQKKSAGFPKNFINVKLLGDAKNIDAIGAKVTVYPHGGLSLTRLILSGRGYLSQSSYTLNFGLDTLRTIDSIVVKWPDGSAQVFPSYPINQTITLTKGLANKELEITTLKTIFQRESAAEMGLDYKHIERDFIDFNIQKTLPHKFSQYGVPIATGDINGDQLDDIVIGASAIQSEKIFYQLPNGKFQADSFLLKLPLEFRAEDAGIVLIDVENDQDLDIILAGGSYENYNSDKDVFNIRLYINDGKGKFSRNTNAIAKSIRTCAGTLRAADIDLDGDIDLFIGGHVLPASFPLHDKSFVLINESKNGILKFLDKSDLWLPKDGQGIINDALFTDFNNDGKPDLLLAKEWGPITLLKNEGHSFKSIENQELKDRLGWWTSLQSEDIDLDGDMDYICGNYGENIYFKCTSHEPITVYAKDFDLNGSLDPFISCHWSDTNGQKKEYFFHGRDDMIKQLISIKRKFQNYTSFGSATVNQVFSKNEMKDATVLKTNTLTSMYLINNGHDKFTVHALPAEAQLAPIFGIQSLDINQDAFPDIILSGNDYGMELIQGLADASQGIVLINNKGKGYFPLHINQSGFILAGESRTMSLFHQHDKTFIIQQINMDSLEIHSIPSTGKLIKLNKEETFATLEINGKKQKLEFFQNKGYKNHCAKNVIIPPGSVLTIQNNLLKTIRSVQN